MVYNAEKYIQESYDIAKFHGFHDVEKSNEHYLMLVITEISELVEADREKREQNIPEFSEATLINNDDESFVESYKKFIKGCPGEELADIAIRLFDWAGTKKLEYRDDVNIVSANFDKFSFTEVAYGLVRILTDKDIEAGDKFNYAIEYTYAIAEYLSIDIEWYIDTKMKYNSLRQRMHGKKY